MSRARPAAIAVVVLFLALLAPGLTPARAHTHAPAQRPAAAPAFSINPAVPGERVRVTGRLPAKVARPVQLERKVGKRWRVAARGRVARTGAYAFSLRATTSTTYRVTAKKVRVRGRTYPALVSRAATLRVQPQQVVIEAPTSVPADQDFEVEAWVRQHRAGQVLALEFLEGGVWKQVNSTETARLVLSRSFPTFDPQSFRAALTGAPARSRVLSRVAVVQPQPAEPKSLVRISEGDFGGFPAGMPANGRMVAWKDPGSGNLLMWDRDMRQSAPPPVGVKPPAGEVAGMSSDLTYAVIETESSQGQGLVLWNSETDAEIVLVPPGNTMPEFGDISADGRYVAYERDVGGFPEVFLWDRATGTTSPISDRGGEITLGPREPQVSDDGNRVVYNANASEFDPVDDAEVVAMWDRGEGAVQILDERFRGVLVSTGEAYLFVGADGELSRLELDLQGRPVTTHDLPGDPTGVQVLAATPGGQFVVFLWTEDGQQDLATWSITEPNPTLTLCDQCVPEDPVWVSDDGRFVTFGTTDPLVAGDDNDVYDAYQWDSSVPQ